MELSGCLQYRDRLWASGVHRDCLGSLGVTSRFLGIDCGHLDCMEMVRMSGIVGIVLWTSVVHWDCPWTYGGWGAISTGHLWNLGLIGER